MGCISLGTMVVKRLFTFGCSFTKYKWLTWADLLAPHYNEFQNWGEAGAGNHYMFNSIMECDQRHKFTPDDTVIVCWTNVMREDRYIDGRGWITLGNIMTTPIYTKEFVTDVVTERGNILRDIAFIKSVLYFLEHKHVTWKFLSMCPFLTIDPWDSRSMNHSNDIYNMYEDVLDCILPSYIEVLGENYWQLNQENRVRYPKGEVDYHPLPSEHIAYLDRVLPGWVTNEAIRTAALKNDMSRSSIITSRYRRF